MINSLSRTTLRSRDDGTWLGALRSVQYKSEIMVQLHMMKQGDTDFRRQADRAVKAWERRFYNQLLRKHIPTYVKFFATNGGVTVIRIEHCFLDHGEVPNKAWHIMARVGERVALDLGNVEVYWDDSDPTAWYVWLKPEPVDLTSCG